MPLLYHLEVIFSTNGGNSRAFFIFRTLESFAWPRLGVNLGCLLDEATATHTVRLLPVSSLASNLSRVFYR